MSASEQRRTLTNGEGVPVVSYLERTHRGRPWADRIEILGPEPVDFILREMSGWTVSCSVELSGQLVAQGARLSRHSHRMSRDLAGPPVDPSWAELAPPAPLRLTGFDRPVRDLLPAWQSAYPPGHPDHFTSDDATAVRELLEPLVAGTLHGPLSPLSGLVVGPDDGVVACVLINLLDGAPPWGGPWITELFRLQEPAYSGLGTLLLRRSVARAAMAGLPALSLAVTDANPVRRLYERLGFVTIDSPVSVVMP